MNLFEYLSMTNNKLEIVDSNGTKRWRNSNKHLHRENGPAVIFINGSMFWYINNRSHRIDGPADVYVDGRKSWWLEDRRIRIFEYD